MMAELNLEEIYEAWKGKYPQEKITPNNDTIMRLELGLAKKFDMEQEQVACMLDVVTPENCQIRSLDLIRIALLLNLEPEIVQELKLLKDAPLEILRKIKFEMRKEAMRYLQKQTDSIKKEQVPKEELDKAMAELQQQYEVEIKEKNKKIEMLEKELTKEREMKKTPQEPEKKIWGMKRPRRKNKKNLKEFARLFGGQEFDDAQTSELIEAYECGVSIADIQAIANTDIPADKMHMLWQLAAK